MAVPPQFLDEIRARVRLADVAGRRVRLIRSGREHLGCCPFHREKTPSFRVYDDGHYHCFGCGAHGSVFDFVMQTENVSFRDALERLAAEAGLEVPVDTPEERERQRKRRSIHDATEAAAAHYEAMLRRPEGKEALAYLHRRGLDDKTIARFRLGYAPNERFVLKAALARDGVDEELMAEAGLIVMPEDGARSPYDRFRNRVMFPIADRQGRIVGFGGRVLGKEEPKYLNSPETPIFHKGRLLYGLAWAAKAARDAGTVIVVEGYMDVIGLAQAGYDNAVAPLGTALTEEQLRELWHLTPEPILCFDPDTAGRRAAARAAERALPLIKPGYGLRFAFLQTDTGDDPDGVVKRYPKQFLQSALSGALSLSEMVFWTESCGRRLRTAEDRAALEGRLKQHALRIADPTVRKNFQRVFNAQLWRQFRGDRAGHAGRERSDASLRADVDPANGVHPVKDAEKTLIAILIHHPDFFHEVEDDIGCVTFSDESLDRMRQALIATLSGATESDAERVKAELRTAGFSEPLDRLWADPLIRSHRLIGPRASLVEVRETWTENMAALKKAARDAELDAVAVQDDQSDEAMAHRLAMKQAALNRSES